MGVVYQARDPHIDRVVAVKVLRTDRVDGEAFVNRFLKEAKVIGRLTHPNIVAIYDIGQEQGSAYIAMEFLEGVSLFDKLREKQPDTAELISLGVQLAEALDYAHKKGVVHRDIKPSNIIVQADGQIKITDFGVAHVDDSSATMQTQAGAILGTPAYMSPEQVLGQPVDGRSDIFSLGVVLYELAAGQRPFGGENKSLMTVLNDIVTICPQEPTALSSAIAPGLSRLIMKTLEKDPAKRFQTGKEVAAALKTCLDAPPAAAPQAASASKPSTAAEPKSPLSIKLVLGALAASLAIAGVGYFALSRNGNEVPPTAVKVSSPPIVVNSPPVVVPTPPVVVSKPAAMVKTAPPPAVQRKAEARRSAPEEKPAKAKKKQHSTVPQVAPRVPEETAPVAAIESSREIPKHKGLFAFLKVGSVPAGAGIYVNGVSKGVTPMTLKLGLGQYQVRLSSPGYHEVEKPVTLEKMKEYPLVVYLKPIE